MKSDNLVQLSGFLTKDVITNEKKSFATFTIGRKVGEDTLYMNCIAFPNQKFKIPFDILAKGNEVCRQVIESDIPSVEKVEYITVQKSKKLLMIIALQVPFVPKMDDLYAQLETSREQGLKLLELLQRGALLGLLKTKVKSVKQMAAPEKMFLDNPNLMYAFNKNPEIGTIRETFFYNQVSRAAEVYCPKNGDFQINYKILIEVGGADKSFNQIKDIPNSYLAIDNVEFGRGNKIPLWLFGFLY